MRKKLFALLALGSLLISTGACSTYPPVEEQVLAYAALQFAKIYQGERYATVHQNKAQQSYYFALKRFENRDFDKARTLFLQSTTLAERAENIARLRDLEEED